VQHDRNANKHASSQQRQIHKGHDDFPTRATVFIIAGGC
jgi:hypothetical protein